MTSILLLRGLQNVELDVIHDKLPPGWGVLFYFWLQFMYFYLIFNEHHITCGEPVYLLGNFTRLLVIDQSNQLQPCLYRSLRQVHKSTIRGMWCVVCGTEVNLFL